MAEESPVRKLALRALKGLKTLSQGFASGCCEAASVCFEERGHTSGVRVTIKLLLGSESEDAVSVEWKPVPQPTRRTWNDLAEAAEYGACGVAFLLISEFTEFSVIERSPKGEGFDYWLGEEDDLFQKKARLEISGTRLGAKEADKRVEVKRRQTDASDASRLPAYIVVVDFGTPTSRVVKK